MLQKQPDATVGAAAADVIAAAVAAAAAGTGAIAADAAAVASLPVEWHDLLQCLQLLVALLQVKTAQQASGSSRSSGNA